MFNYSNITEESLAWLYDTYTPSQRNFLSIVVNNWKGDALKDPTSFERAYLQGWICGAWILAGDEAPSSWQEDINLIYRIFLNRTLFEREI